MHQHHIRRVRRQRLQPRTDAGLAGGAAGHDGQMHKASEHGRDRLRLTNRLDQVDLGR
jgi:hypothetical protein